MQVIETQFQKTSYKSVTQQPAVNSNVICALYAEEEVFTEGDFEYTVENGEASITEYTGSAENLIIPDALGGYEVTHIGDSAFFRCDSLLTIEIPDSVTHIGDC